MKHFQSMPSSERGRFLTTAKQKKKVTLSIDSATYDAFQQYCDENAIMLSKRIELFMKDLLGKKGG